MEEFDLVVLTKDIPKAKLKSGDVGTIVMVYNDGAGYEVEFITLDGETLAVETLSSSQIRSIGHREMSHTRVMVG
ncbi:MAG: DUF4926 domain-containing protein [Candidatus Hatepunaea meridiana]|nr:DUF4926 domain-containing protein [Candidatus Hatepunaea meridiana]